jgi:membrane associated rhomboid family serine protease
MARDLSIRRDPRRKEPPALKSFMAMFQLNSGCFRAGQLNGIPLIAMRGRGRIGADILDNDIEDTEEAPRRHEPIFNIPNSLTAYIAVMALIHIVRVFVLSPDQDTNVRLTMAFLPARYLYPLGAQDIGWLIGPVGYSFLHGSFTHLIFNCLWLVVFATPLVQRIGAGRFAILWVTSAVASAFFHAVLTGWSDEMLIGASGVVSATVGAACRFSMPLSGSFAMRTARDAPTLGIIEALRNRQVVIFILIWALSNAMVVWGAGIPDGGSYNIAWQAHLGGFLFGFLTFGLFDRRQKP